MSPRLISDIDISIGGNIQNAFYRKIAAGIVTLLSQLFVWGIPELDLRQEPPLQHPERQPQCPAVTNWDITAPNCV